MRPFAFVSLLCLIELLGLPVQVSLDVPFLEACKRETATTLTKTGRENDGPSQATTIQDDKASTLRYSCCCVVHLRRPNLTFQTPSRTIETPRFEARARFPPFVPACRQTLLSTPPSKEVKGGHGGRYCSRYGANNPSSSGGTSEAAESAGEAERPTAGHEGVFHTVKGINIVRYEYSIVLLLLLWLCGEAM